MQEFRIKVNGKVYEVEVEEMGNPAPTTEKAAPETVKAVAPAAAQTGAGTGTTPSAEGKETVTAPMPGKILALKVVSGQKVQKGDLLLILEAMKMENEIFAGTDGVVQGIKVSEGAAVDVDDVLLVIV